ncbi:unnamed protein product [Durusdinium trenchii]|uniref:Uncharacterized protein n=1 Tax=Durusdinium trenchii TaxID=1381693 RepID=A0ABP0QWH1_9DINO
MTRAAAAVMKRPAVGATTVATKAKATAMKTSTAMKASPARKAPCAMKVTVMKTSAMKVSAMKVTAMKTTVMKATAKKGSAMKGTALKKPPVKKKLTTTKAVRRKPAVKKVPAKKKRPPAWRDAIEGLVKTKRCKDFLRYAHRIEDINEVALRYPGWLGALARNQMGGAPSSSEKLHVLLELGLDPDTEDLLLESIYGPGNSFELLLDYGADPLGRNPQKSYMGCPFCVAAHEENDGRVYQVSRLKEALFEHPKYEHSAEQEWLSAVERMHEMLLQEHGDVRSGVREGIYQLLSSFVTRVSVGDPTETLPVREEVSEGHSPAKRGESRLADTCVILELR